MSGSTEVNLNAPFDPVPFRLVGPSDDRGVIGQIQRSGGSYEPGVMQAIRQALGPDSVAFDIGANIGVFAVVMARLVPQGRVYAFEPALETHAYLEANLRANGRGNFVAEQCAAYNSTGTVQFVFSPSYPAGSFVGDAAQGGELRTVPAVRLDDYVERHGIDRVDLIMVDAEGAEMSVLRGAERTLARHRPTLLVEANPALLLRFGTSSYHQLAAHLGRTHVLHAIGEDGAPARIVSDRHLDLLLRREGVTDLLCLPRARSWSPRARRRGARQLAELEAEFAGPGVPPNNFVLDPAFGISPPADPVVAGPGQEFALAVEVDNTSPYWFSSDFLYYPINVSYRWLDAAGAAVDAPMNRARFDPPLEPGGSQKVEVRVSAPSQPGEYTLAFTLVQENFAWLDDLDPSLRFGVPATIAPS